mmetsp:Transcript_3954/g.10158  ORF Transcript_3954/g.10158 Transcript_3954/m.10158 type:complete len:105 (-) Transcript_3954:155-469(-)
MVSFGIRLLAASTMCWALVPSVTTPSRPGVAVKAVDVDFTPIAAVLAVGAAVMATDTSSAPKKAVAGAPPAEVLMETAETIVEDVATPEPEAAAEEEAPAKVAE